MNGYDYWKWRNKKRHCHVIFGYILQLDKFDNVLTLTFLQYHNVLNAKLKHNKSLKIGSSCRMIQLDLCPADRAADTVTTIVIRNISGRGSLVHWFYWLVLLAMAGHVAWTAAIGQLGSQHRGRLLERPIATQGTNMKPRQLGESGAIWDTGLSWTTYFLYVDLIEINIL